MTTGEVRLKLVNYWEKDDTRCESWTPGRLGLRGGEEACTSGTRDENERFFFLLLS